MSLIHWFKEGGFTMFPTLACGAALIAVAVQYAQKPSGRWVPLLLSLGTLTLLSGLAGLVMGIIATSAVGNAPDLPTARIAILGVGESLHNLALALVLGMVAASAVTVGAYRQQRAG
jgi:vacuolar-type H+-ATPase subunit I/STV1